MGCTNSDSNSKNGCVVYTQPDGAPGRTAQYVNDITTYNAICHKIRDQDKSLRYQHFYFIQTGTEEQIQNYKSLQNAMKALQKKQQLSLDLVFCPIIGQLSGELEKLNYFLPRIVKLLNHDEYINRIGYSLTPNCIITSIDRHYRAKPTNADFVYLDSDNKHVRGKLELDGNYSPYDAVRMVSITTKTEQDIPHERLNTDGPPTRVYLLAASVENPAISIYEIDNVKSYRTDFLIYKAKLPPSATGSLLVDANTFKPIGLHLNCDYGAGRGVLFRALVREMKKNHPVGVRISQIVAQEELTPGNATQEIYDHENSAGEEEIILEEETTAFAHKIPVGAGHMFVPPSFQDPVPDQNPNLPPNRESKETVVTLEVIAENRIIYPVKECRQGAIFSRSAILFSDNNLIVYGPLKNYYATCDLGEFSLSPGLSICSTISLVIVTGVSCSELSNIGLLINKKLIVSKMPKPLKSHEYHGSTMIESKCMLIGGEHTRTCETFNFITQKWEKDSKLPIKLQQFAITNAHGKVYISGGWKGDSKTPTAAIYRHSNGGWDRLSTKLPHKLHSHFFAEISASKFVILGGERETHSNWSAYLFDTETESISSEHPIELEQVIPCACALPSKCIDNMLYIFLAPKTMLFLDVNKKKQDIVTIELD